jgi:adenylate kinase
LGDVAKAAMDLGELVKDEFVLEMVDKRIHQDDCREGYVLDGFPRSIPQAQKLEMLDRAKEVAIEIFLEDTVVIQRLSSRRICSSCGMIYNLLVKVPEQTGICDACGGTLIQRDDDKPEVIEERLRVYHGLTEPLVDYYRAKGVFQRIKGNDAIQSVFEGICRLLDDALSESEGNRD